MGQERKCYVVQVGGRVWVDTTVAVIATSPEEAAKMARKGVKCDTEAWFRNPHISEAPAVWDVSEETWDELQMADQKHLLGPQREFGGGAT